MRIRTAFAVALVSGLACLGVPTSAAADELPSAPAETSEVTAAAEDPVAEPTPDPTDVPTSGVTEPEPEEAEAPASTGAPVETTADPSASAAEEPDETADPSQPAGTPEGTQDPGTVEATAVGEAAVEALSTQQETSSVEEIWRDPRASVGDVNCSDLTVPLTLDNSRSAVSVLYGWDDGSGGDSEHGFEPSVAAGATMIVHVAVVEDTTITISAGAHGLHIRDFRPLTRATMIVDCTVDDVANDPLASISDVNCSTRTVAVTLDNSRSISDATYRISVWDLDQYFSEPKSESVEAFQVSAGAMRTVPIAVAEDSFVTVEVALTNPADSSSRLASKSSMVDCERNREIAGATVGNVDCSTMTFPVNLDNSTVNRRNEFFVGTYHFYLAFAWPFEAYFSDYHLALAAGTTRVVQVPVANHSRVQVSAGSSVERFRFDEGPLATRLVVVNCRPTPAAGQAPRHSAVMSGRLPQTGGFNGALPLLGVALLAAGGGMLVITGRKRPGAS